MDVDWKKLIELRERHRCTALQAVGRDRREAKAGEAQCRQAKAQWQSQVAAKAEHWQATAGVLSGGACSIGQLCHAGAWSRALDTHIAQAAQGVSQAQAVAAQRQAVLDASVLQLRSASANVEKARQMQQRTQAQRRQLLDLRLEDTLEEAAAQARAARRQGRGC